MSTSYQMAFMEIFLAICQIFIQEPREFQRDSLSEKMILRLTWTICRFFNDVQWQKYCSRHVDSFFYSNFELNIVCPYFSHILWVATNLSSGINWCLLCLQNNFNYGSCWTEICKVQLLWKFWDAVKTKLIFCWLNFLKV